MAFFMIRLKLISLRNIRNPEIMKNVGTAHVVMGCIVS